LLLSRLLVLFSSFSLSLFLRVCLCVYVCLVMLCTGATLFLPETLNPHTPKRPLNPLRPIWLLMAPSIAVVVLFSSSLSLSVGLVYAHDWPFTHLNSVCQCQYHVRHDGAFSISLSAFTHLSLSLSLFSLSFSLSLSLLFYLFCSLLLCLSSHL